MTVNDDSEGGRRGDGSGPEEPAGGREQAAPDAVPAVCGCVALLAKWGEMGEAGANKEETAREMEMWGNGPGDETEREAEQPVARGNRSRGERRCLACPRDGGRRRSGQAAGKGKDPFSVGLPEPPSAGDCRVAGAFWPVRMPEKAMRGTSGETMPCPLRGWTGF